MGGSRRSHTCELSASPSIVLVMTDVEWLRLQHELLQAQYGGLYDRVRELVLQANLIEASGAEHLHAYAAQLRAVLASMHDARSVSDVEEILRQHLAYGSDAVRGISAERLHHVAAEIWAAWRAFIGS
jgi:hypothetical protein